MRYVLTTNGTHGDIGHFWHALYDVLNNVCSFVRVDYSVEESSVDIHADVVFGIYDLMRHIDYFGLELDRPDVLSQWVVVMKTWLQGVFESSELFDKP